MSVNIKIEDLFEKDIKRNINGVIKVDQNDEANVYTELDEYVITQESRKHFDQFFERYYNAMHTPTDKMGVWISGFFGSGKSHFIKIVSYLLENKTVSGKSALDFFEHKINDDPQMFTSIEQTVKYGTKDVILFNIDSKAGDSKERIVDIMMRAFNEHRGLFSEVFWIAEFEEDMQDKGLYDAFKNEIKRISGKTWEDIRDSYSFEQDYIIEALTNCGYQSKDASVRMFESDGANYHLDVDKFAKKVAKYCRSRGNDHQIIFLVDEIGQYIGEDNELILNLQTVVEELGTKLSGKAWVIVTSQADIDAITKEKVRGYDFSKIQARFDTRLSMSSANVDEVIKARILLKKKEHREMLASFYAEKNIILKNLISFSKGSAEMKNYNNEGDFADVYPFVPYQFNLLQKVFEKIRTTGFTGKHLAKGERSMLSAFQEAAVKYGECDIGVLIPFHLFYNTVESFLDPIIKRTITQAENNNHLMIHDCELLKTLFMIRHVPVLPATLDNLVVLSISNIDEDKLKLKERIMGSLQRLGEQTLINKSSDTFHFLTNEEQEINREIKNMNVEKHLILDEVYNVVYNSNDICPTKYKDYKFDKYVDEKIKKSTDADLSIKFLTPLSDEIMRGSGQQSIMGDNLSNIDSINTLLLIFPVDSKFIDQIKERLQIEKYLKQNNSNGDYDGLKNILSAKQSDMVSLENSSKSAIFEGARNARIFVDGKEVASIKKKNPKERIKEGLDILVKNVYNKFNYITKDYESDSDVLRILMSDDLEKFGAGTSETNNLALDAIVAHISIHDEINKTVVLKDLKDKFTRMPYGWKDMTISGLIAMLFVSEDVKLRYLKTPLVSNPDEIMKYITKKEHADKVIIEMRKKSDIETINSVKSILRGVFDKTDIPEKENDLYSFSHNLLDKELRRVMEISGKYAEENYPGKGIIEKYASFLEKMLKITDPPSFLKEVSETKAEFIEQHQTVEPVMSFFGGVQVEIFRRLSRDIEGFKRNVQFLDEDAKSGVARIEDILSLDEPYSQIKDLTQFENKIKVSLGESLSNLKQEFQNKLVDVKGDVDEELGKYNGFSDEFKRSVLQPFSEVERFIAGSDDCSYVKFQIGEIDELCRIAYEYIEKEKPVVKDVEHGGYDAGARVGDSNGDSGNANANVNGNGNGNSPTRSVRVVKGTSLFKTKKDIETDEDLDEYLGNLRVAIQDMLENNNVKVL